MRRTCTKLAATLLCLSLGRAEAAAVISTLYTTTDLGVGSQLRADPDGSFHGVSNLDGTLTYRFDKSPVKSIDERVEGSSSSHAFTQYLFDVDVPNSFLGDKIGYTFDNTGWAGYYYPSFLNWAGGWHTYLNSPFLPVSDVNDSGQVVGTGTMLDWPDIRYHYAAFTTADGGSHGHGSMYFDNLNNYIVPIPGVYLKSALKIDDLGRILALGGDNHDYLLTPVELGPAATVPEPTTLMLLGLLGSGLALRSVRRKRRP